LQDSCFYLILDAIALGLFNIVCEGAIIGVASIDEVDVILANGFGVGENAVAVDVLFRGVSLAKKSHETRVIERITKMNNLIIVVMIMMMKRLH
jgi:hypothetical protein